MCMSKMADFKHLLLLVAAFLVNPSLQLELIQPVTITRPAQASLDESASISCTLAPWLEMATDGCTFTTPEGIVLNVDFNSGEVINDDTQAIMPGYNGVQDGTALTCGIDIEAVKQEDLGEWTCHMEHENGPYHEGIFQLLTEGHLEEIRLPRHLDTLLYVVNVIPHVENNTFNGNNQFVLSHDGDHTEAEKFRNQVCLHINGLFIDEESVTVRYFQTPNPILGFGYDLDRQFLVLNTELNLDYIAPQRTFHIITMDYVGSLDQNLVGFYETSYVNEDDETVPVAVTDFEPIDARRAYPCLDEPDRKARFQISIVHENSTTAYSNDELRESEAAPEYGENWVKDTFMNAPAMSTYLTAWVLSDFVRTYSTIDTRVAVVQPPGKEDQAVLALQVAETLLSEMEIYFSINYPMTKLDMVAVPDFKAGAMENWGMMTFRESSLLFVDEVSTQRDYERIVEVIAHELSHQWFGNLVTMTWWEDLWLNEGFATYMENIGKDFFDPNLHSQDRVVLFDLHDVFEIDSLASSTPLSKQVDNPAYDLSLSRISYGKGNCILRMTEHAITLDAFNQGVNNYLNEFDFENANRFDLWASLDAAAHTAGTLDEDLDLSIILEGWAVKEGYPVLTVDSVSGTQVEVSQEQFFISTNAPDSTFSWYIPVNVEHPGGDFTDTAPALWIKDDEMSINIDVDSLPYILNTKETGYYRVNYDSENWQALIDSLKSDITQINSLNRAQLIDDSFNLARAGQLEYETALGLSQYLPGEVDYIPLKAALNSFIYLDKLFREESEYSYLMVYIKVQFLETYKKYGFTSNTGDVYMDVLIREEIITIMCKYNHKDCVDQSANYFEEYMDATSGSVNPIPLDIKGAVYESAIAHGSQAEWDFLWNEYVTSDVDSERKRILYALGATEEEYIILDYLSKTIDAGSGLKEQDVSYVYNAVGRTATGRSVQFNWLNDEFEAIRDYFGSSLSSVVGDIVESFARGGKTQEDIDALETFKTDTQEDLAGTTDAVIALAIEAIDINIMWNDEFFMEVTNWLVDNAGPQEPDIPSVSAITINRPQYITLDTEVSISCNLAPWLQMDTYDIGCTFTNPSGSVLLVDFFTGDVTNSQTQEIVSGYNGMIDATGLTCGLDIEDVSQEDVGEWICHMEQEIGPYHEGIFQMLTEGHLEDVRLPRHLDTLLYVVDIIPNVEDSTFLGHSQSVLSHDGNHTEPERFRNQVVFHSNGLFIKEKSARVQYFRENNPILGFGYDLERQFLLLNTENNLDWIAPRRTFHIITMDYVGSLDQNLAGFYETSYVNDAEETVPVAVTNFEPIDARRAYPCLDEPDRKARFQFSIVHENSTNAYSNDELRESEAAPEYGDNWVRDTFNLAEEMSTYLTAWVLSDFVRTYSTVDTRVGVVHPPGKEDQVGPALEIAETLLPDMEAYFDIDYPMPKLDMVTVPDLKAGAMENWGMLIFRESSLLFVDEISTQKDYENIVTIITHELSHQWFGNLVTMTWWDDLWLNEGFATYMENFGKDLYNPDLNTRDLFYLHDVFEIDSLASSTPLSLQIDNPAYDVPLTKISYGKGSCLLRMTEHAITLDAFNQGVNIYLNAFDHSNADRFDLWASLDTAAHDAGTLDEDLDLSIILEGWAVKEGYPVLTVDSVSGTQVEVSQQRFFISTNAPDSTFSWYIPVNVEHPGGDFTDTAPSLWIKDDEMSIDIEVDSLPYILNTKETGYYRVNYDSDNWQALIGTLKSYTNQIDSLNRAQLIDDSFNLARAGQLEYETALVLSQYLPREVDYTPLKAALNSFIYLDQLFREESEYSYLMTYVKDQFLDTYEKYGFTSNTGDIYMDVLIREEMITIMCKYNLKDCVDQSASYFGDYMDATFGSVNPIPLDIKGAVYESAIAHGSQAEWNFLWSEYLSSDVDSERKRMLYALGATEEESIILDYLSKTIDSSSGLKEQDASYVYNAVGRTATGRIVQFNWLNDEFDAIQSYFGSSLSSVASEIIENFARGGKTQEDIVALETFQTDTQEDIVGGLDTIIALAIESININIMWNDAFFMEVSEWLIDNTDVTGPPTGSTEEPITEEPITELPTTEEPTSTVVPTTEEPVETTEEQTVQPQSTIASSESTEQSEISSTLITTEATPEPVEPTTQSLPPSAAGKLAVHPIVTLFLAFAIMVLLI